MTGLVRGAAGGLAGVIVALAAHLGIGLDADTVVIVLTALVGTLATAAVHAAEDRWPAVRAVVAWLGREASPLATLPVIHTVTPVTGPAAEVGHQAVVDPRRSGGGNVTMVVPPAPGQPSGPSTGTP